jgi:hypothetical protein
MRSHVRRVSVLAGLTIMAIAAGCSPSAPPPAAKSEQDALHERQMVIRLEEMMPPNLASSTGPGSLAKQSQAELAEQQ